MAQALRVFLRLRDNMAILWLPQLLGTFLGTREAGTHPAGTLGQNSIYQRKNGIYRPNA